MAGRPLTLLNLPWDIRLQILEYLLRSPTPLSRVTRVVEVSRFERTNKFRTDDIVYWRFEAGGDLDLHPSILGVCRQLYREGYEILYSTNVLRVHTALYNDFTPVDILGHWRFDDFADPIPGSRLPQIGRFRNFEFRIWVDFTRPDPRVGDEDLWNLCGLVACARVGGLGRVVVHVVDGSSGARYRHEMYAGSWRKTLEALRSLRCEEFKVEGDMPGSCVRQLYRWTMDGIQ